MADFHLWGCPGPFTIASEPSRGDGYILLTLRGANGTELARRVVDPSLAQEEYQILDRLRGQLDRAVKVLEVELTKEADGRRPREMPYYFDGAEPEKRAHSGDGGVFLGCYSLSTLALLVLIPWLGAVLLVIGAGVGSLAILGSALGALERRSTKLRNVKSHYLRVVSASKGETHSLGDYGAGRLSADYGVSRRFREKPVVYVRVKDRIVMAVFGDDVVEAAEIVGREALRQVKETERLERETASKEDQANEAARHIAELEARRRIENP